MSLLVKIIIAALSSAGLLSGVALSYIAPEELDAGRKYFLYLRYALFVILSLAILYSLYFHFIFLVPVFSILFVIMFLVDVKINTKIAYFFSYLVFLAGYFLLEDGLLIAVLIFLYGFPVGTLLRVKHE